MAAKNIATTHITNGAYRLHPVEWNIGESAGVLAAFCHSSGVKPSVIWEEEEWLHRFQKELLERGIPLFWSVDLGLDDPDFAAIQPFLMNNSIPLESVRYQRLHVLPDEQLSRREAEWLMACHPHARQNSRLEKMINRWHKNPHAPFSSDDFRSASVCLDLPTGLVGDYPTLRQVCLNLAKT